MLGSGEIMKALVAMSGGVDSSVAALLTQRLGYECIGATMKLYANAQNDEVDYGENIKSACSLSEPEDAKQVAENLGMPHYIIDFSAEFKQDVIDRFIHAYVSGATPNPCVDCNSFLKFGSLYDYAKNLGAEKIVTGHYARIYHDENSDRYLLRRAVDSEKDQSYFLYNIPQIKLKDILFPLGEMTKAETRKVAEEAGFINAKKKESQDICFVDKDGYAKFIEKTTMLNYPEGNFVDINGSIVGKHSGLIRYTIGQRKGLGVAMGRPVYVCEIRPETNEVVLGENEDLYSDSVEIADVNLIAFSKIIEPLRSEVMIRYNSKPVPAVVSPTEKEGVLSIKFDNPVRAVAKGQAAVFYNEDIVIGGGRII